MKKIILLLFVMPLVAYGQRGNRAQPGKMYDAGEALYSPRYGLSAVVPTGWSGLLPRESEVFLLSSNTSPAEIFVLGREKSDLATLKAEWESGFALDKQINLKAKNAVIKNGVLSSEAVFQGVRVDKNSRKAYATARCSEFGPCVTFLVLTFPAEYEKTVADAESLVQSIKFSKPSNESPYVNFDWKKFLTGKVMITYANMEQGSKESQLDLCADGTFTANISKRGIMKNQNPAYRGKLSGTWTAEGIGETGKLILEFKKKGLSPMEANLYINDEKIYSNDERYFAGTSEKCK